MVPVQGRQPAAEFFGTDRGSVDPRATFVLDPFQHKAQWVLAQHLRHRHSPRGAQRPQSHCFALVEVRRRTCPAFEEHRPPRGLADKDLRDRSASDRADFSHSEALREVRWQVHR